MVMMLSFGAILMIACVVFASYGVLYWLFGGSRPASATPEVVTRRASAPSWLTPVILVGMVVFGLRAGMPFWLVVLGSVFAVVMLVKLNVLSFTSDTCTMGPTPPPLPRDGRFQNATYHATHTPPQSSSGFGAAAAVATVILVIGLVVAGVSFVREERVPTARNLSMVVHEGWTSAMHEAPAELQREMHEFNREMKVSAHEVAKAVKDAAQVVKSAPMPPPVPPQQKIIISSAIPPTEPDRIDKVLGRTNGKVFENSNKPKKGSKPQPKAQSKPPVSPPTPVVREPAIRVDYNRTKEELVDFPIDKSPNGVYVILTDPKDHLDDYQAAYQRSLELLKNHLFAKHPEAARDPNSLNLPSFAWSEANGLVHKRFEPVDNVRVFALGTNFSPKAMDLAYNYHLGVERTRGAAKGYFGGLLVLGGLGLLLRIGTGVRPTAPVPKA